MIFGVHDSKLSVETLSHTRAFKPDRHFMLEFDCEK